MHHIARRNTCKSAKLRCAELIAAPGPSYHIAFAGDAYRTSALVMAVAFPHHAVQEKTAPDALCEIAGQDACKAKKRGTLWRRVRTLSPRPRSGYSQISPMRKPSTATRKAPGSRRSGRR